MKPATSLPWNTNRKSVIPRIFGPEIGLRGSAEQVPANGKDAAYIVHAANAYPRLVEALRAMIEEHVVRCPALNKAESLLRELGEI